ncbi:hypothetical protein K9M74_05545 [Candidatus Woesearchaeota archaeon]|nr:hypothetical protein [Candidatus Woesearchaeota archaeon]
MHSFTTGAIVAYKTIDRISTTGIILPKTDFLDLFIKENGSWPTAQEYTKQIEARFGNRLPFNQFGDEIPLFDRIWNRCAASSSRIILPSESFLKSSSHLGVHNIDRKIEGNRTQRSYDIILVTDCQYIAEVGTRRDVLIVADEVVQELFLDN